MTDYEAVGRTNYFSVRDTAALEELLSDSAIELVHDTKRGRVALLDGDGTDWTIGIEDGEDELYLPDVIAEHLAPGQVAVFLHVGAEATRCVAGYAIAVSDKGNREVVNLYDIYEKAARAFGVDVDAISVAERWDIAP